MKIQLHIKLTNGQAAAVTVDRQSMSLQLDNIEIDLTNVKEITLKPMVSLIDETRVALGRDICDEAMKAAKSREQI